MVEFERMIGREIESGRMNVEFGNPGVNKAGSYNSLTKTATVRSEYIRQAIETGDWRTVRSILNHEGQHHYDYALRPLEKPKNHVRRPLNDRLNPKQEPQRELRAHARQLEFDIKHNHRPKQLITKAYFEPAKGKASNQSCADQISKQYIKIQKYLNGAFKNK